MRSGVSKYLLLLFFWIPASFSSKEAGAQIPYRFIEFAQLSPTWDEALPLGNGLLGSLIWNKENSIRVSLDRADLWDERPMKGLHGPHFSYKWVHQKWKSGQYEDVQKALDHPYDREPAPTKIPGAAIELPVQLLGKSTSVNLDLFTASAVVKGTDGASLESFVDANQPYGWMRITGAKIASVPNLIPPAYSGAVKISGDVVGGDDLTRLGYQQGEVEVGENYKSYVQHGWGDFIYRVTVMWQTKASITEILWTIDVSHNGKIPKLPLPKLAAVLAQGYENAFDKHKEWWSAHWDKSSIEIPSDTLMKQWYLTRYFMGATSRKGAPPISLQSVWTADNGRIPPWKGDYHHDLNTELSYWPFYSANDLEGAAVFIDHLESNKKNYKRYTKSYFNKKGLNVPGVTTLKGTEMGGWIQYALSPTISSWLAHHYDLQWKYSGDRDFLKIYAYPWFKETAEFLAGVTYLDSNGVRKLPLSSSPEFYDNSAAAWFSQNTNYDLSLMRYVFQRSASLAKILGKHKEAEKWSKILKSLPDLALSKNDELEVASGIPYTYSHRHFSHLLPIYPLSLLTKEDNKQIIDRSIDKLVSVGSKAWVGYSFAWEGNLFARAGNGEKAAEALTVFSRAFCLSNGFHVNGDQSGKGYSNFTYRPFTLEGNFAFAAGLQEMLIQSHNGFIELFPAVPNDWKNISFKKLRAEGGFLLNVEQKNGIMDTISITATVDGSLNLKLPGNWRWEVNGEFKEAQLKNGFLTGILTKGTVVYLKKND